MTVDGLAFTLFRQPGGGRTKNREGRHVFGNKREITFGDVHVVAPKFQPMTGAVCDCVMAAISLRCVLVAMGRQLHLRLGYVDPIKSKKLVKSSKTTLSGKAAERAIAQLASEWNHVERWLSLRSAIRDAVPLVRNDLESLRDLTRATMPNVGKWYGRSFHEVAVGTTCAMLKFVAAVTWSMPPNFDPLSDDTSPDAEKFAGVDWISYFGIDGSGFWSTGSRPEFSTETFDDLRREVVYEAEQASRRQRAEKTVKRIDQPEKEVLPNGYFDPAQFQRDQLIHTQLVNGKTQQSVISEVNRLAAAEGWEKITTHGGLKRCAKRYATALEIDPPANRKPGRRRSPSG